MLTSLSYFSCDILYIFFVLSAATLISLDEFMFFMSIFKTC